MLSDFDAIRNRHIIFILVLASLILYAKSVSFTYTYTDDVRLVALNQGVLDDFRNFPRLFTTDAFMSVGSTQLFYRPLMNVLFMLESQIASGSTALYHGTNVLLHLACCILLFRVLVQLGTARSLAGLTALLFCVHPLNTSAVVWIPGRNDTLLTLWILGSFSFLLQAVATKKLSSLIGHFVLFLGALLTKESAVVFPVLTVSYLWLFHRGDMTRKLWLGGIAGYCLATMVWFGLRSLVPETSAVHMKTDFILVNAIGNLPAILLYLGKIFFPVNLSIFPNLADTTLWPGIIALAILIAMFLLKKPPEVKRMLWGFGWFLIFLLPTFVAGFIFFEHRAYTAFFGFLFALLQFPVVRSFETSKTHHWAFAGLVLVLFSVVTMAHSEQYRNRAAYATSAYLADPSIDASYANMAELFIGEGNYTGAEAILRKGLAKNPAMNTTHRVLADVLAHRGDYPEAAREYEISLRLNPLQLNTYIMYGKMCLDAGWVDEASRVWKTSVAVNPGFVLGYYYLANFYVHVKNDPDSAMLYVGQIQRQGAPVMQELLDAIHASQKVNH